MEKAMNDYLDWEIRAARRSRPRRHRGLAAHGAGGPTVRHRPEIHDAAGKLCEVARDGTAAWLRTARGGPRRHRPETRDAVEKLCEVARDGTAA